MTSLAVRPVNNPDELALFADNWTSLGKPFSEKFRAACERVAGRHNGWVDPNLVRDELIDEPDYSPRTYSAQWGPACGKSGFMVKTDVEVPIQADGSKGNGNKNVRLRRWVG